MQIPSSCSLPAFGKVAISVLTWVLIFEENFLCYLLLNKFLIFILELNSSVGRNDHFIVA